MLFKLSIRESLDELEKVNQKQKKKMAAMPKIEYI